MRGPLISVRTQFGRLRSDALINSGAHLTQFRIGKLLNSYELVFGIALEKQFVEQTMRVEIFLAVIAVSLMGALIGFALN